MRLENLPRLSDENREALNDGYVAIEGVPASDPAPHPRLLSDWAVALTGIALVIAVVIYYGATVKLEDREREESRDDE